MPHNPNKPHEMRYLSRVDIAKKGTGGETHAWQFRLKRGDVNISRFFSDSKYGGKEEALKCAQQFRDEIEKLYPPITDREKYLRRTKKNTSGVVGVHRIERDYTKLNRPSKYHDSAWVASWIDDSGKKVFRRFSIPRHGEPEAFRLAITTRRQAVDGLLGKRIESQHDWELKPLDKLLSSVELSKTSDEKGKSLEDLLVRLFSDSSSFSVNEIRAITETEEIDIMVLNKSTDPRFMRESAILLVECKNWSGKCGKNEFVIFKEKIENRKSRCSLGFLISWNGFAETVTKEMLRGSREEALIIPLDGDDIKKAVYESQFEQTLASAWDRAISI
jgi:hypothetical protein